LEAEVNILNLFLSRVTVSKTDGRTGEMLNVVIQ